MLNTAVEQHWITPDQFTQVVQALEAMPEISALDLLHEQQFLSEDQAGALRQAISDAEAQAHTDEAADTHGDEAAHVAAVEAAAPPPPIPEEKPKSTPPPRPAATPAQAAAAGHEITASHLPPAYGSIPRAVYADGYEHLDDFLRYAKETGGSDVHIGVDAPPLIRIFGGLRPLWEGAPNMQPEHTLYIIQGFLDEEQWDRLHKDHSIEFSYSNSFGRFRTSVIRQRKGYDIVLRIISTNVRSMDELGLPNALKVLTRYHNGLVLITGSVGSGKSTTLASFVEEINRDRRDHIITLEDPIEYIFEPKGCQITQREVHLHTESFANALRGALRQDPDVVMVGEMRDLETIQLAITASETGHLVLATLHTSTAGRTLDRILDAFPVEQQAQIRTMVSESLRGIVSQQLIPRIDGKGRVLALEVLMNTPAVAALIRDAKTFMLPGIMQIGRKLGMRLMDDALLDLVKQKIISGEEAFDRAEQKATFAPYMK